VIGATLSHYDQKRIDKEQDNEAQSQDGFKQTRGNSLPRIGSIGSAIG